MGLCKRDGFRKATKKVNFKSAQRERSFEVARQLSEWELTCGAIVACEPSSIAVTFVCIRQINAFAQVSAWSESYQYAVVNWNIEKINKRYLKHKNLFAVITLKKKTTKRKHI